MPITLAMLQAHGNQVFILTVCHNFIPSGETRLKFHMEPGSS